MNRSDFQALAQSRLDEARALWDKDYFHGCYYLAGYVVECALKACIARSTMEGDFPDKGKVDRSWKHDLEGLLGVAGLERQLADDSKIEKEIGDNWAVAKDWKETSRYDRTIDEKRARDLLNAIAESPSGVLAWLQRYW